MTVTTAYPQSRGAVGTAIKTIPGKTGVSGTRFRPPIVAIFAQGAAANTYGTTKRQIFSHEEVGAIEGWGSPAHLAALHVFQEFGGGIGDIQVWLFPLDQPGTGTAAAGSITPSGTITTTQTHYVKFNNIVSEPVIFVADDAVDDMCDKLTAAINAVLKMPVTAADGDTVCNWTANWEGASGNNLYCEVVSPIDSEAEFAIINPTGVGGTDGAGTPDITDALTQIGSTWFTHIVNALDYTDDTELNEYQAFGATRWASEVHKPLTVYTGTAEATLATVTAVTDARTADNVNVILPNPGSNDLPFVIAAEAVREIAKADAENPPVDYCEKDYRKLTGLTAGAASSQWKSAQRESAYDAGCSSFRVIDDIVCLSDTLTCYHPTGESPPLYKHVVDISKISQVLNELDAEFGDISGRVLIPDAQSSNNPKAIRPKNARATMNGISERLAGDSIISDPDYSTANSDAGIGTTNPKRFDIKYVAKLSGNANVVSIDFAAGFHYGGA